MKKSIKNKSKCSNLKTLGFTLVELLAVIVILGVLALITFPIIDGTIKNSKEKALASTIKSIEDAAYNYSVKNDIGYQTYYKKITLDELVKAGLLENEIINPVTNNKMAGCVLYKWDEIYKQYEFKYDETCPLITYQDDSGANIPELLNNMVPIKYQNNNWVIADISQEWYNYNEKEWANAVVLEDGVSKNIGDVITEEDIALWYVWIPRYKYQLFNVGTTGVEEQQIQIKFENGIETTGTVKCEDIDFKANPTSEVSEICTNAELGNWYTHPAFTFGDQELTGFWIGKFEISGTTDNITIKPNVNSLTNETNATFSNSIKKLSDIYNLNGDSHMIKNMEWGAVTYLTQSQYGRCTDGICSDIGRNNNSNLITGCGEEEGVNSSSICNMYNTQIGMNASTTGNTYGVYDMSGGAWERVMSTTSDINGDFKLTEFDFEENLDDKYYDKYVYGDSTISHERGKLGDGTKETMKTFGNLSGGWYNDYIKFPSKSYTWFTRGGTYGNTPIYAGLFYTDINAAAALEYRSSRAILTKN